MIGFSHRLSISRVQLPTTLRIVERTSLVDWCARDRAMAERVELADAAILETSRLPLRVTLNEIGRYTGNASWLDKHLARLPRTAELLFQVLESTAAFETRRLAWREKNTVGAPG